MRELSEICELFNGAKDHEALGRVLEEAVNAIGFGRYVYYRMRPRISDTGAKLSNYPATWIDHYDHRAYQQLDPILLESSRTIAPIPWKRLQACYAADRGVNRFLNEATDFGLCDGISVPVHGPNHSLDILSICAPLQPGEAIEDAPVTAELCCVLGVLARQTYDRIGPAEEEVPVNLTPREREVLLWTARGKTAWEIGQILNISDQTAVFHLKNVGRKFGSYSKQHAVVQAILQGLINP